MKRVPKYKGEHDVKMLYDWSSWKSNEMKGGLQCLENKHRSGWNTLEFTQKLNVLQFSYIVQSKRGLIWDSIYWIKIELHLA